MRTQSLLALILSLSLVSPGFPAKTPKAPKAGTDLALFNKKLKKDEQIRFALERLTFGPRAGDYEIVRKVGLKKWIDLQLHPDSIKENPVLEAKLAPLDSLRMTQQEIAQTYPPPQLIAQVARGRAPLPEDPVTRAAVERLAKRYRAKNNIAASQSTREEDMVEPAVPLQDLLTPPQIRTLRSGKPDERRALLASIDKEKYDDLAIALPQGMRFQNMQYAPVEMRRMFLRATAPQQVLASDLNENKLFRAVYSNRQLDELMVDFWYNHFNVYLDKGADRLYVPSYERDAIRPYALANFKDLLKATAESPAMLFYLDNWQSVGPLPVNPRAAQRPNAPKRPVRGLNENYGRELLELHTLGVDGGYTQKDIIEVARCFTGWTIRDPRGGGGFWYNDRVHDKGEKVVLGVTIPAGGGKEDGEKVLDILLHHPSTAKFIATKLAVRFVADNPPPALVDRMAQTFADTSGDIRAVMQTMLDSKEFWSVGTQHAKIKTPYEMIASAIRAIGANIDFGTNLATQLANLGQPLYRKVEPTGYSALNAEWVNSSALLGRMNFALALTQNKIPGVRLDASATLPDSTNSTVIAKALLNRDVTPQTRSAIEKALEEQVKKNPKAQPSAAIIAGLVLGSPDFQRR
ncbi:MAG: DUF1800 domain-containing protein [Bryobacteraceae bacterium]